MQDSNSSRHVVTGPHLWSQACLFLPMCLSLVSGSGETKRAFPSSASVLPDLAASFAIKLSSFEAQGIYHQDDAKEDLKVRGGHEVLDPLVHQPGLRTQLLPKRSLRQSIEQIQRIEYLPPARCARCIYACMCFKTNTFLFRTSVYRCFTGYSTCKCNLFVSLRRLDNACRPHKPV